MKYIISIVMPTYNASRKIEKSLQSIRNQNFDQSKVEILVVDAGSTDDTVEIANKYDAKILFNERKLPEIAKQIGFENSEGEWIIFIDADEMFLDMNSFKRRIDFLRKHKAVKNLVSTGMSCAQHEIGINRYSNYISDPFSNFVYRYNGYNRLESMNKRFKHKTYENGVIYSFKNSNYYPLYDALGNMFNTRAARIIYEKQGKSANFIANVFNNMVSETKCTAMLKDDYVLHEPGMNEEKYKEKMIWRIKNNLFADEGVGFSGRTDVNMYLKKRKYMYVIYSLLFVPVVYDAIKLSIKNKDWYFMKHIYWNEFVFFNILKYVLAKMLKIPVVADKSYGNR